MPKQDIRQRVKRLVSDVMKKGDKVDVRARWEKICEDKPDGWDEITLELGPMPEATLDDIPLETAINYAARDADATLRINTVLDHEIDSIGLRGIYNLDMSVIPMVDRMQHIGMRINPEHFRLLAEHLSDLMVVKVGEIRSAVSTWTKGRVVIADDFNPNSGDQVADLLFTRQGLNLKSLKRTKSGKRDSTNDKVLEALVFKCPPIRFICDYRELAKLRDSFAVTLPLAADEDHRIHPRFKATRVSSGRFSMVDPNLLAIPVRSELGKLIRQGFVASEGKLLGSWDLDQIEMREMAHQSQDPVMIQLFLDGKDIHRMTGAMAFGCKPEDVTVIQRYAAKRIGFGVITGITEIGLCEQMALAGAEGWDEQTCAKAISEYFRIYRGVKRMLDDSRAEARRYSHVRDRWGRIRYLPGVHSELSWIREEALRQSHSFKISASAQGTMKMGMAAIWAWWKYEHMLGSVEPLLQIHDSLMVECEDDEGFKSNLSDGVVHFMCNTPGTEMCVPIKAKGGFANDWGSID